MPTKNHKHSMSQQERAFWREAFLSSPYRCQDLNEEIRRRTDFANAAVDAYRKTITWRQQ